MIKALEAADSSGVFRYQTGTGNWEPSTLYLWKDMIAGELTAPSSKCNN
jgi:hypothetical protein